MTFTFGVAIGLLIGLLIGGLVGAVFMAVCIAGTRNDADEKAPRDYNGVNVDNIKYAMGKRYADPTRRERP